MDQLVQCVFTTPSPGERLREVAVLTSGRPDAVERFWLIYEPVLSATIVRLT